MGIEDCAKIPKTLSLLTRVNQEQKELIIA